MLNIYHCLSYVLFKEWHICAILLPATFWHELSTQPNSTTTCSQAWSYIYIKQASYCQFYIYLSYSLTCINTAYYCTNHILGCFLKLQQIFGIFMLQLHTSSDTHLWQLVIRIVLSLKYLLNSSVILTKHMQ